MLLKLLLAFTLIPVAEIYVLIKIGGHIGAFNTVLMVILTAFAGAYLAQLQSMQTMLRIRANLKQGLMPKDEMVDAVIIFVAGIVLLTPGFITDLAGLLLLLPVTRKHFKRFLKYKLDQYVKNQEIHISHYS